MQFLYPAYLFGLSLIAIPIIIHLFKLRRYKTVYFSSLNCLKDAQTTFKNKSRLKDILLLIIRILFIIAIVLSFAKPYHPSEIDYKKQSSGVVCLYVDASHSMENQAIEHSVFDQAKLKAIETVKKYPLGTSFIIIDQNDPLSYYTYIDRYQAIDNISSLTINHSSASFSNIISPVLNFSSRRSSKQDLTGFHIFSDFQESFLDTQNLPDSIAQSISLHPIRTENSSNIYIDSCWLEQPVHHFGSRVSISGKIINSGMQHYKQFPITLMVNDSLASRTSINLPAETTKNFSISYLPDQNGDQNIELRINDYPLDFDNSFFLTFSLKRKTSICHLYSSEPNQYISSAMQSDSAFAYSEYPLTAFPENDFSAYQTVIVTGLDNSDWLTGTNLLSFVENGGNLIIFPDSASSIQGINALSRKFNAPTLLNAYTEKEVMKFAPAMKDFHFNISLNPESTVNWPKISNYFSMSRLGIASQVILQGNSMRPFLVSTKIVNGLYILSGVPLKYSSTNIGEHPLFIPLLYFISTAESRQTVVYSRIGSQEAYPLSIPQNYKKKIKIFDSRSDFMTIPQQETHPDNPVISLFLNDFTGPSGFIMADMGDGKTASIAMNYPRNESAMNYYSKEDLIEITANLGSNIAVTQMDSVKLSSKKTRENQQSSLVSLSRLLLLFALSMLIIETLLFRINT